MTTVCTKRWLGAALAAAVLGTVGCDPYLEENKAAPSILRVLVFDGQHSAGINPVFASEGPGSPSYAIPGFIDPSLDPVTTGGQLSVLDIQFNNVLDGASIQTAPDDCTPAAGGLTATVTGGSSKSGAAWYACYSPSSAVQDTGASIYVFRASDQTDLTTAEFPSGANISIAGQVRGQRGETVAVSVALQTGLSKDPPAFANETTTSIGVSWFAGGASTFTLQRADAACDPATNVFADVAGCVGIAGTTCNDTGLATASDHCYRVLRSGSANAAPNTTGYGGDASTAPVAPAAPTFGTVTSTSVVVNWTAVTGATGYAVERAPDVSGAPGTFVEVTTTTGTTYTDANLTASTTYWYRIVALRGGAASVPGPSASVTTL